jgi:hypothetical protein
VVGLAARGAVSISWRLADGRAEKKGRTRHRWQQRFGLPTALAAAQKLYGPTFNPEITLKALSYFDDGNLRALPEEMKSRLVVAAREVDVEHLPEITGIIGPKQQD